jgi:hypothetical protein
MLKHFLVGLVVFCGSSVANATLLVNYTFNGVNDANSWTPVVGDYGSTGATNFSTILNAGAFTNQGTTGNGIPGDINNSEWWTSTGIAVSVSNDRYNSLTLAPISAGLGDGSITIESMQFKMAKTSLGTAGNEVKARVDYQLTPTSSWVTVGTASSITTSLATYSFTFGTPIVLNKDSSASTFRFLWSRTQLPVGSNSGQGKLDDVSFFGAYAVPEPSTYAVSVFGSLAAFGLFRRYRRK